MNGYGGPQVPDRPDEPATRAEVHHYVTRAAEVMEMQEKQIQELNGALIRANEMMKTMNDSIMKLAQDQEIFRMTLEGMFAERKH